MADELNNPVDLFDQLQRDPGFQLYPNAMRLAALLRRTESFRDFQQAKLGLGQQLTSELGNLYTASLPSWIAAGLEDAYHQNVDIAGQSFWAIGYGSGDASEAIPLQVSPSWREAAAKIKFHHALANAQDLQQVQYEALHDQGQDIITPSQSTIPLPILSIQRYGERYDSEFQDLAVPYYQFNSAD